MAKLLFCIKIKSIIRSILFLCMMALPHLKVVANAPPESTVNHYLMQVHPQMFMDYFGNFTNMSTGTMKNGGRVCYYGNVVNWGIYQYQNTGYERFLGKKPQIIAGNKELLIYDASLENTQGLTISNHVKIAKNFSFVNGMVHTNRDTLNNQLHFLQNTNYKGEKDKAHVDGYVAKTGNEIFSFPIGDGNEIHRVDISAPNTVTQKIDAAFFNKAPKLFTSFVNTLQKINPVEYWIMHGSAAVNVTLHWRISSKIKDLSLDLTKLRVVGLKNGVWQDLGNIKTSGNTDEGSVSSIPIQPGDYEQITIGVSKTGVVHLVKISPKVILQGAYDITNNLMHDSIRIAGFLPAKEPYTGLGSFKHVGGGGGNSAGTGVFNVLGLNAIVDWIFVSVRSETDSSKVIATKSALVQRDGDVVDASDGKSVLEFTLPPGRYFIAVQHRNHLGVMTKAAIGLSQTTTTIDFTAQKTLSFGKNAQKIMSNGRTVLWAGNTNLDKRIVYVGTGTDYTNISAKVLSAPANTPAFSKSYVVKGYHLEDVDMNAKVIYVGTGTDQTLISQNVLLHPENVSFTKSKPIQEQLPL